MSKEVYGVSLPLVSDNTTIGEAVRIAHNVNSPVIVATRGNEFWLHQTSDLKAAAATPLTNMTTGKLIPTLPNDKRGLLGPDLSHIEISRLGGLFDNDDAAACGLVVTSVASDFQGNRTVIALTNEKGLFRVVAKVWVCPKDDEEFRHSGTCPTHGCQLQEKQ